MLCFFCGNEFEIIKAGSGGKTVFSVMIVFLKNQIEGKNKNRVKLIMQMSDRIKITRGCDKCGYDKCAKALDWHHQDENKELNPSDAATYSCETYIKEISKCDLLCANCHRELHS